MNGGVGFWKSSSSLNYPKTTMAYSSFMPANSSMFPKRTPLASLDDDTLPNPFNTAIRTSVSCNYGEDPKLGFANGFGPNYDSNKNVPFLGNQSKLDSNPEFYNPWSHRTFLSSRQVSANEDQLRSSGNPGLMSPNSVNLDALVAKLVSDDDNAGDPTVNFNRYTHVEDSNPFMGHNRLVDQLNYWSVQDAPNIAKVRQPMKPDMNLFAQSKPCFESNGNCYAGGDVAALNNKVCHYNTQFWKAERTNFHKPSEPLFNNYALNSVQKSFNQSTSIQKNALQKEQINQQYLQPVQQSRAPVNSNQAPTQIRSIRAAVRNSSIAGVAPQNDLHYRIERCYEQFRFLERERKKIEQELSAKFPGKKVSSANSIPIARLPQNPSRIDRLIVDQYREHAKVITLIAKMETLQGNREMYAMIHETVQEWLEAIRKLQYERKDDLVTNQRRTNNAAEDFYDYICSQISLAVHKLCVKTRAARTALWCSATSTLESTHSAADLL